MKINANDGNSGKHFVHNLDGDFLVMECTSADDESGEYEIIPSQKFKWEGMKESYTFVNEGGKTVRLKVKNNIKILCIDNKEDKAIIDRLQSIKKEIPQPSKDIGELEDFKRSCG